MTHTESKVWFVTGASTGLGRAVVVHLLEKGENVVATLRKPAAISDLSLKYPDTQLLVLKLDVVSPAEITTAFEQAIAKFGRIDVVYNNTGYSVLAEVEGTPDDVARGVFEVNFWGATNVSREAIRVFRDVNKPRGGRLLQASSTVGINSMGGVGFYSASKYALEGISQALSNELHPSWNIKVTLVELGVFNTSITTPQNFVVVPQHSAYSAPDSATTGLRAYVAGGVGKDGSDADKAARELYKIAYDDSVGLRVPLGLDALQVVGTVAEQYLKDVEASRQWSTDLSTEVNA